MLFSQSVSSASKISTLMCVSCAHGHCAEQLLSSGCRISAVRHTWEETPRAFVCAPLPCGKTTLFDERRAESLAGPGENSIDARLQLPGRAAAAPPST